MTATTEKLTEKDIKKVPHLNAIGPDTPKPAPAFTNEEYRDRLRRIRQLMAQEKIDLLLVSGPDSMYYFHGYNARYYRGHGTTAEPPIAGTAIHVDQDYLIHFDYPMEEALLAGTSVADEIRFLPEGKPAEELASAMMEALKHEGWLGGTVGMEFSSHVPNPAVSNTIKSAFLSNGCTQVLDATGPIRAVRRVKSVQELNYIKEAARICDIGHQAGKEVLRPGVTELEVCGEIVRAMYAAGGETAGIVNGVISGPFLHLHGWSTRRVIQKGDIVVFDLTGVFNRYHSTAVRSYFVGDPPRELVKLNRIVGRSFDILQEVIKDGSLVHEVCRTLWQYYRDSGVWELYEWAGGFEFGISFPPDSVGEFYWTLDDEGGETFRSNEVTTYYAQFNTQIADTYIVDKNKASRLSKVPDELIIVD